MSIEDIKVPRDGMEVFGEFPDGEDYSKAIELRNRLIGFRRVVGVSSRVRPAGQIYHIAASCGESTWDIIPRLHQGFSLPDGKVLRLEPKGSRYRVYVN